jgi:4-hydroxy-tetrahydrodipicolinate synthase
MQSIGVDTVVIHPPTYYPLSADHLLTYFGKLADTIKIPIIIYNIPSTTHHSIPLDVVDELSHHSNIIGIKDSERNLDRLEESLKMWANREDFVHLLGWGAQFSNALLNGSAGIVPSTANITPFLYSSMAEEAQKDNQDDVLHLQKITDRFSEIYQKGKLLSDSLAALKIILNEMDLCGTTVLLPLMQLKEDDAAHVTKQFQQQKDQMKNDPFGKHIVWP